MQVKIFDRTKILFKETLKQKPIYSKNVGESLQKSLYQIIQTNERPIRKTEQHDDSQALNYWITASFT